MSQTLSASLATGITLSQPGAYETPFTITPTGTIANASGTGVYSAVAGAYLANQGSISAAFRGVSFQDSATVVNAAGAQIYGQALGIYLGGDGTVSNSGTIAGQADAIFFNGPQNNVLIADPGAVFSGNVVAYGISNVLELAAGNSIGTLTGIGAQFTGFNTIAFNPGAAWTLSAEAAGLESGQTIIGFAAGDTIDLTNFAATSVLSITGTGLELSGNDGAIPIDFAGITLAQNLAVRPDGAGGTDITFRLNTLSTSLGSGISLTAYGAYGAPFTITPTGTISAPSGAGVYTTLAGAYLANHGSILALTGVELKAGGFVTNAADAGISATGFGVEINDPGTVTNAGDISSANAGVLLNAGGTVTNSGTLAGYDAVVAQGNPATVINRGLINALADGAGVERAIWLRAGGTVLNIGTIASPTNAVPAVLFQAGSANRLIADPGAVIIGGVQAIGGSNVLELAAGAPAGTLTGLGSQFTGFDTIAFDPGATWSLAGDIAGLASGQTITGFASGDTIDVTNFAATSATYISGIGLELSSAASTINIGISGSAYSQYISIAPDGTAGTDISFLASTQTLSTSIDHGITLTAAGHYLSPFTITPTGSIRQNILAANPGVLSRDPGATLLNQGTIVADVQGVILYAQGYVSNAANAEIAGHLAAVFTYDFGTVANAGTMSGGIGTGVFLNAGGLLANSGGGATIIAYQPVSSPDPATIINRGGLIVSDSQLNFDSAISLNSGGTILNSGTIESPDLAIVFGTAGTDLLIADPGAVFMGSVLAKGSVSTLELASASTTGTLSGIGSQFTGFDTIAFDPGAAWSLGGDAAGLASGQIITGFAGTDTIDVTNFAATGETFVPGTGLELTAAAGTLTLDLSGNIYPGVLTLTPDGNGGTDITMPSTHTLSTSISQGITLTAAGRYLSPFTITPAGAVIISNVFGFGVSSTLAGVSLTNQGGIYAANGVILRASGEVINAANATISGGNNGVVFYGISTLTNAGTLYGGINGVASRGLTTITNSGVIQSSLNAPELTMPRIALNLGAGGTVTNSGTIASEGEAIFFGYAKAPNLLISDPGAVFIGYVQAMGNSNVLELAAGATTGSLAGIGSQFNGFNTIAFDPGAAWTLSGDAAGLASGQTITGFSAGDTIDLTGFTATSYSVGAAGLTLSNGLTSETLGITGISHASITSDGGTGTDITTSVACFVRGTRIATPRGNIPIEKLHVGDLVKTLHGDQPIRWIGRRAYAGRFIAGNPDALPIRIRRHAIAPNIPSRDLYVSPDHAIAEAGVLIHAHLLQNGISITQPATEKDVEYFHLEFDTHTLLFAENISTESFIDEGAGNRFQNSHTRIPTVKPQKPCLPRVFEGFHLHNIKSRIAARAGIHPPTTLGGLIGTIDEATPTLIRGWAQNSAAPEHPVTLEIISGAYKQLILANAFRPDLRNHGLGSGCHGFSLTLPNLAGPITLRRLSDGALLAPARHPSLRAQRSNPEPELNASQTAAA